MATSAKRQNDVPTARELAEQLADRIETLCQRLLPTGEFAPGRRAWRVGSVAGEAGSALRIHLTGPRRGRWRDFKSDLGGDALDLVAEVECGGDRKAAWRWAVDWLGLGRTTEAGPSDLAERRHCAELSRQRRDQELRRQAQVQQSAARRLWLAAKPLRRGDVVCRYLEGRGIAFDRLEELPGALRCHPNLWNAESRQHWPALVAAISAPDGAHVNTHRIWLEVRPDGSVRKAQLEKPKLSMAGGYAGGGVRLWHGASGKAWKAMPEGETVLAGEGVEDVLTVVCARPEWRAVAVLSVSSLSSVVLPPACSRLIWLAQNDPPGSPASRTLAAALRAHRASGRQVAVLRPPVFVKDINDFAMWLRGGAASPPRAA